MAGLRRNENIFVKMTSRSACPAVYPTAIPMSWLSTVLCHGETHDNDGFKLGPKWIGYVIRTLDFGLFAPDLREVKKKKKKVRRLLPMDIKSADNMPHAVTRVPAA